MRIRDRNKILGRKQRFRFRNHNFYRRSALVYTPSLNSIYIHFSRFSGSSDSYIACIDYCTPHNITRPLCGHSHSCCSKGGHMSADDVMFLFMVEVL